MKTTDIEVTDEMKTIMNKSDIFLMHFVNVFLNMKIINFVKITPDSFPRFNELRCFHHVVLQDIKINLKTDTCIIKTSIMTETHESEVVKLVTETEFHYNDQTDSDLINSYKQFIYIVARMYVKSFMINYFSKNYNYGYDEGIKIWDEYYESRFNINVPEAVSKLPIYRVNIRRRWN